MYDFQAHTKADRSSRSSRRCRRSTITTSCSTPKTSTVFFTQPGVRIDLGGIGKGYAVDRGIAILQSRGVTHALVTAGGDSRIIGDRFGKPWIVGIRHPDDKNQRHREDPARRHGDFDVGRLRTLLRRRRRALSPHHRSAHGALGEQGAQRDDPRVDGDAHRRAVEDRVRARRRRSDENLRDARRRRRDPRHAGRQGAVFEGPRTRRRHGTGCAAPPAANVCNETSHEETVLVRRLRCSARTRWAGLRCTAARRSTRCGSSSPRCACTRSAIVSTARGSRPKCCRSTPRAQRPRSD